MAGGRWHSRDSEVARRSRRCRRYCFLPPLPQPSRDLVAAICCHLDMPYLPRLVSTSFVEIAFLYYLMRAWPSYSNLGTCTITARCF